MKKIFPYLMLLFAVALIARAVRAPKNSTEFDLVRFGNLPVLTNGRIKPLDTVARSSLLQFQHKQTWTRPDTPDLGTWERIVARFSRDPRFRRLTPTEWLLDVIFRSEVADTYQIFEIDNPDVLALFRLETNAGLGGKRFSFHQLSPRLGELETQTKLARDVDAAVRTPFQRGTVQIYNNILQYQRLKHSFVLPGADDFLAQLLAFQDQVSAGVAAVRARQAGEPHDEAAVNAMLKFGDQFSVMQDVSNLLIIPPDAESGGTENWKTAGEALLETFRTGQVNPHALAYAGLAHSWRQQTPAPFNKLLELFGAGLEKRLGPALEKVAIEARFNAAQPFYQSALLYCFALFLGVFSWLVWPEALRKSAFWLLILACCASTAGILARMWLEGRPPVTNLYSSALFVGWVAVVLCIVLEAIYKNSIGAVAGGWIGFATLLIAHHLSLSGDTLEMMRAVLDSNFWLATHVVVVAAGYSATFLAGFLAIIYILRGVFTTTLDKATADALSRMVYGIVCFATLFSFTGTVLGGIWADQSWGRFWGWDPKENGALMIVIWNAIILHARWGGMVKQRGLMCLAVGGNIITSWSWFGTNMLGVGLHSYGFTDAAFVALTLFVLSQVAIIVLGNIPLEKWRSFRSGGGLPPAAPPEVASASSR